MPIRSSFICRLEGRPRLIVHLQEKGQESWGEAAPLPGWSQETIEEIACQVITMTPPFAPSLTFGILSALALLRDPLSELPPLPVSYFLRGSAAEIAVQAEKALLNGFKSAKIKIDNLPFQDALYLLRHLKDHLRLRVDLNRAWDLEEALDFFSNFKKNDFDYIEEPLKNPKELVHFTHPFALDESLREEFFIDTPLLKTLVIKPTLHTDWLKWLSTGKEIVFSSSYESDLGHAHIAIMAARLKKTSIPLGLGTLNCNSESLLEESLTLANGHLILPKKLTVKKELLHALPLPH